jgi:hypothetical protein
MKRFPATLALVALAAIGLAAGLATTGLAADPDPPNQGDPDKVLTVSSGYACSGTVVPGAKVEGGGLGPTITVSAPSPIVKVTIKSGSKAEFVDDDWEGDFLSGWITISQDVSNYVVWTCSGTTTTTTETTPTTTETTPTTTETTPTTTETTPTTTETTPTTTETTPTSETTPTTTETTPAVTTTAESTPTVPAAPFTPPQAPPKPVAKPAGGVAGVQTQPARPKAPLLPPTAPVTRTAAGANAPTQPELAYTP